MASPLSISTELHGDAGCGDLSVCLNITRKDDAMKSIAQWSMDRPNNLRRYEDRTHPRFVRRYAGQDLHFEDIYRILRSQAPSGRNLEAGDVLLDLGCGTGWYARRLSTDERCRNTRIFGLDISENALAVARESQIAVSSVADVAYRYADLRAGISIRAAQEIWFCGSWHQTGDPLKALKNAAAALDEDGVLHIQTYCADPQNKQSFDVAVMKYVGHRVFEYGEIDDMAQKSGLAVIARTERGMVELCTMQHVQS